MNKKSQIFIIGVAVLFTAFFVWIALSTDNSVNDKNDNVNKNVLQSSENQTNQEKSTEGATIIDNNSKVNTTTPASTNSEPRKETSSTEKNSTDMVSKGSENEVNIGKETDKAKTSGLPEASTDLKEDFIIYDVKQGDTLSTIIKEFAESSPPKITSKAILSANKLTTATEIKAGMKIKIPSKYKNGSKYTVTSGDSLYTIAATYMNDMKIYDAIEKIKKDNFLIADNIKIGDELFLAGVSKIKEEDKAISTSSTNGKTENSSEKYISYTVKKGETLKSIIKQYEKYCPTTVSSKTILKINNLSSASEVKEGMTIKIPEEYFIKGEKYTIKFGDSLSKIAVTYMKELEMYKAIEKIMKDNFKSNDNIRVGEEIFISSTEL
jgi:LysM repeat protein